MPGGKGVNVARTLKTLGQPVIATGFAGGATGTRIVEQLTEESILNDFVRIREESRTNTAVLDPTNGEQTEINERGPAVSAEGGRALPRQAALPRARRRRRRLRRLAAARRRARHLRARSSASCASSASQTVVDADGEPMRHAVRAEPDVISPNVLEAEELVGHEFNDDEDRAIAVREMVQLGAREAIMTLPDGCVASRPRRRRSRRCYRVWIEPREAVAPVGSGDAFLAGFVAARYTGAAAGRVPALRRRLRRRVDPAPRRRAHRAARGRAAGRADRGRARRAAGRGALRSARPLERLVRPRTAGSAAIVGRRGRRRHSLAVAVPDPARAGSSRPPATLGCPDGDRDRPREEGPPRLRIRRHRDRALAAHARPRRRRHLLEARRLPLRAAAARLGDGRRRLARDGAGSSASSAAWPSSTSRASSPATRTPTSSSSASRSCPRTRRRARCRRSTRSRSSPS